MILSQYKKNYSSLEIVTGQSLNLSHPRVREFFSDLSVDYLSEISKSILSDPRVREFPDVASFAFWIRKSNLLAKKNTYHDQFYRRGLGLVVHIAPSNVPVNFAFSWAFGVLAGNSNLIRVPTKKYGQVEIILDSIRKVNDLPEFATISSSSGFVRYERSLELTEEFFAYADARVIWGGDDSVRSLSSLQSKVGSRLMTFPDKYSLAVLSAKSLISASQADIENLARNFVNDAFLFDQNACSSPRSIFWIGTTQDASQAMKIFWDAILRRASTEYDLPTANLVSKFALACEMAATNSGLDTLVISSPKVFRLQMSNDAMDLASLQSRFGIFPEKTLPALRDLIQVISEKCQTVTYFGFQKAELLETLKHLEYSGIDRVVPIGQALDMDMIWDGIDIPNALTRIMDLK